MGRYRILVVDDEEGMLEVCADTLRAIEGVDVVVEEDGRRAESRLSSERFDVLVADVRMPRSDGIDLVRTAREIEPDLAVIVMTACPSVDTAVETRKLGAVDHIAKPFHPEHLRVLVERVLEEHRLRDENRVLQRHVERDFGFDELVGVSPALARIAETIDRVADSDVDVLVTGEAGSAKERVARALHRASPRSSNRFVPVSCSAIPAALFEGELFGVSSRSIGLMEYTHGGTLFLDEIADLPIRTQAALIRALRNRRIRRVGGQAEIPVDVRIVAGSAHDPELLVREGRLRDDLLFRISAVSLDIPPLRDRPEDIRPLAESFVRRFARQCNTRVTGLAEETLEVLECYSWPGNVREFERVIRRGIAITRNATIGVQDLPEHVVTGRTRGPKRRTNGFFRLREQHEQQVERDYLHGLLSRHHGDVTAAAAEARIPRGTLYRLLEEFGIKAAKYRL